MSFNWRLLLAPEPVLDYVVWHEACHLRVIDHSPRFWALVRQHCPDYARAPALADGSGVYIGALVPLDGREGGPWEGPWRSPRSS